MSTTSILIIAFAIGIITGLRSMTGPAVVTWAAHLKWINLQHSSLSFLGSSPATYIFTVLAVGELIIDKLPKTPRRTTVGPLAARLIFGGLCGAAVCSSAELSVLVGGLLGGIGGVAGGFAGYEIRRRVVQGLKAPAFLVALIEDAIAIGGGLFLVSRL